MYRRTRGCDPNAVISAVTDGPGNPWQVSDCVHNPPRMRRKCPALTVQRDAAAVSVEEPESERRLKPGNLAAHARLGKAQQFGRAGHAAGVGDGQESLQITGLGHIRRTAIA